MGVAADTIIGGGASDLGGFSAVVAIPVKDEAERIGPCLAALAAQEATDCTFSVVLLLNNCRDATAAIVRQLAPGLPFGLHMVERELAPQHAHAGWARRLAMDHAAALLGAAATRQRIILTTDADGRVCPGWLEANLAAFRRGAELVAGVAVADPLELHLVSDELMRRGDLEQRYEDLLAEIEARLDPDPHDPWPNHRAAPGASLAVTLDAYRRVGGMPAVPCSEDRAFVAALRAIGARIRHSPDARVLVSLRIQGRAAGGMADAIRERLLMPEAPCDAMLLPVDDHVRQVRARRGIGRLVTSSIPPSRRLTPSELPGQIERAIRFLAGLPLPASVAAPPLEDIQPIVLGPGLLNDSEHRPSVLEKQLDGDIAV